MSDVVGVEHRGEGDALILFLGELGTILRKERPIEKF
jgi:hypothetical protein